MPNLPTLLPAEFCAGAARSVGIHDGHPDFLQQQLHCDGNVRSVAKRREMVEGQDEMSVHELDIEAHRPVNVTKGQELMSQ